jgi:putative Mg2+ transporter-C (MgtC) family protein
MLHSVGTLTLLLRVIVGFALTFVLGFERELRGSPAGDRTFSLIGVAATVLGIVAGAGSPNAVAGGVTGIGFIGGGIVFRRAVGSGELISGITTAASIFAATAIGAAAGLGLVDVAALATALVLISLEAPHIPLLRSLDASRWSARFGDADGFRRDDDTTIRRLSHLRGRVPAMTKSRVTMVIRNLRWQSDRRLGSTNHSDSPDGRRYASAGFE